MSEEDLQPDHDLGYTHSNLRDNMTTLRFNEFIFWMRGQTYTASDDGEAVYYHRDVEKFLAGKRYHDD